MVRRTIFVFHTFGSFKRNASPIWVPGVAELASTLGKMLRYQTVGIRTTRTIFARIDTVSIDTGFVQRTIWIVSASDGDTSREGVAFKAFMAAAIGNVILRETEGVRSTRIVEQARIDTGAFNAGFRVFTFGVGLASWIDAGNQRIADLSRRTSTHWFMAFNETFSSFATVKKYKRISITSRVVQVHF